MAVTATPYGKFIMALGQGQFNFDTDTVYAMLCGSAYTADQDNHEFISQITNEVTGTGYNAGGKALTGVTWTYTDYSKLGQLNADSVTWASASFTARYAVIYKYTGNTATSRLIGWVDFGADRSPAAEDFVLAVPSGVLRIRAV